MRAARAGARRRRDPRARRALRERLDARPRAQRASRADRAVAPRARQRDLVRRRISCDELTASLTARVAVAQLQHRRRLARSRSRGSVSTNSGRRPRRPASSSSACASTSPVSSTPRSCARSRGTVFEWPHDDRHGPGRQRVEPREELAWVSPAGTASTARGPAPSRRSGASVSCVRLNSLANRLVDAAAARAAAPAPARAAPGADSDRIARVARRVLLAVPRHEQRCAPRVAPRASRLAPAPGARRPARPGRRTATLREERDGTGARGSSGSSGNGCGRAADGGQGARDDGSGHAERPRGRLRRARR